MSRINQGPRGVHAQEITHEGAPVRIPNPEQRLRRSVMACLLWEKTFYEEGESIAQRIKDGVAACSPEFVSALAIQARSEYRMRHVPLLLARELARNTHGKIVGHTIQNVIQRADELTEFLAIYGEGQERANTIKPIAKQVKVGLAAAFQKFDAYQLAKYNRKNPVTLRDALFLCHAKPKDEKQQKDWTDLVNGTLTTPDTWETSLSAGGDKKTEFTRLLSENKLGYMALLRNLRNMEESGVDRDLVRRAIGFGAARSKALPFRFISAAKHAPAFEPELDAAMQLAMNSLPRLHGRSAVLIDCSGSMSSPVSGKSEIRCREAATALAILVGGTCEKFDVFVFGTDVAQVPARANLGLMTTVEAVNSYGYGRSGVEVGHGTNIGGAVRKAEHTDNYDRIIVITDGQSHDTLANPHGTGYILNVAAYQNGVGYGPWVNIDGFSEASVRFITELEGEGDAIHA